jgi:hypothetical protein
MLDSGKSTEEVFQHFLGMYDLNINLINNRESGDNAIEDLVNKKLPELEKEAPDNAKTKRKQARDAFRDQLHDLRSLILNDEASKKGGGGGGKDPKWKKILNVILIITATATGVVAGAGIMREIKNAQIRSLEAASTSQIDNLTSEKNRALLSASIVRIKNVSRRLTNDSPSQAVKKDLLLVEPQIKNLQERFLKDPSEVISDAHKIHNFLVQVATKHVREKVAAGATPENVVFEITNFMSDGETTKISAIEYNEQTNDTVTNPDGSPKLKDPGKINKVVIDAGSFLVPSSSTTGSQK